MKDRKLIILFFDFTYFSQQIKSAKEIGFVVADKEEDATDQILVEWSQSKKKMRYKRLVDGKPSLSCKELSIGGNLHLEAFPLLMIPLATPIQVEMPAFSAGDRVRINPQLGIGEFKKKMKCRGGFKDEMAKVAKKMLLVTIISYKTAIKFHLHLLPVYRSHWNSLKNE